MHRIIKPFSLSPTTLWCGMNAYLSYWRADFHAPLYNKLHTEMKTHGFTQKWWNGRMVDLSDWRALRSPISITKSTISTRGVKRLHKLEQEYKSIIAYDKNANIENCDWEIVEGLFDVAAEIKQAKWGSPVFASKLCHFILPELFPVFDTTALQEASKFLLLSSNPTKEDYRKYWEYCHDLWRVCNCKTRLKRNLSIKIKAAKGNPANYPWATRIPEICLMNPNPKCL